MVLRVLLVNVGLRRRRVTICCFLDYLWFVLKWILTSPFGTYKNWRNKTSFAIESFVAKLAHLKIQPMEPEVRGVQVPKKNIAGTYEYRTKLGMTKVVLRGSWGCHHCKTDRGPPYLRMSFRLCPQLIWVFPKIGGVYPKSSIFKWVWDLQPTHFGVPLFLETPIS